MMLSERDVRDFGLALACSGNEELLQFYRSLTGPKHYEFARVVAQAFRAGRDFLSFEEMHGVHSLYEDLHGKTFTGGADDECD